MSWGKISGFWGHAQVRVTGSAPERFINLVAAAGIRLWAAKIDGQELQFNTDLISLKKLMEVRKNTGYIVEVQKKQGLLVFAGFLWQRKLLLAGFFCFWLCLYYLAGIIWTLDIDGMTSLEKSDVLDYVASLGLEKWANFRRLDLDAIEEQLYLRFPEIAWVAVERSGTKVSIRIVEKEPDPLRLGEPIDIVADCDGIISEMTVIQGKPLVEPGMTVAKGDVLIAGYRGDAGIVNAAGYVKAIVHVEGYGEAALRETEREFTGNQAQVTALQLGKKRIFLSSREHGFVHYGMKESRRPLRGNLGLPVYLVEQIYREVKLITKVYTPEEADELARSRAMRMAHQQVGEHADLLKAEVKNINLDAIFRYKVTLTIETKIGRESQSSGGEDY